MGVQDIAPSFNNPPTFKDLDDVRKYVKEVVDKVAIALNELDFMVNGNIDLNNIRAKSITADRMNVTELSAITANMGKLTSGEIYGAYIATAEGTYPRSEMSSTQNLFGAYSDASNRVTMETTGPGSTPATNYYNADSATLPRGSDYLTEIGGNTYYTMFGAERIQITASQIWMNGPVLINSYADITDGGLTLQDQLDLLQTQITNLKNRYDVHEHAYSGTDSGGDTYSGTTGGPNN